MPSGSLNFRSKFFFLLIISEIEEKCPARLLNSLLCFRDIVDLETEVMRANEVLGIIEARATFPEIIQQRQVYGAVAQVDSGGKVELLLPDAFEIEDALIKFCGFFEVANNESKVP